jgi:hypothetical protein
MAPLRRQEPRSKHAPVDLTGGLLLIRVIQRGSALLLRPDPAVLPQHLRVNDQVPEWPDRSHATASGQSVRLHVHGQLAAVAASSVRDPTDVHHAAHCPVADLRRPLVVEQVERGERERGELWAGPGGAQIRRQLLAERRRLGDEGSVSHTSIVS